jgi:hypothetical protein
VRHLAEDVGDSEGPPELPGAEQTLAQLSAADLLLGLDSAARAAPTKLIPGNLNPFGSDSTDGAELTDAGVAQVLAPLERIRPRASDLSAESWGHRAPCCRDGPDDPLFPRLTNM